MSRGRGFSSAISNGQGPRFCSCCGSLDSGPVTFSFGAASFELTNGLGLGAVSLPASVFRDAFELVGLLDFSIIVESVPS